jgi:hypothetical protein
MLWQKGLRFALLSVALVGCTLGEQRHPSTPAPTSTMAPLVEATPPSLASPETDSPPDFPVLETSTGPYPNAVSLLDGVCFEYLYTLNGQTWVWSTPGELAAFYDQADASNLCPEPVERAAFDFGGNVLAGAVNVSTGCDAAHRVVDLIQDDGTRTQVLFLQLQVEGECPYELVQPFLVAIPRPPAGYVLRVVVTPS